MIWNEFWEAVITSEKGTEIHVSKRRGNIGTVNAECVTENGKQTEVYNTTWQLKKTTTHQHCLEMPIRRHSVLLSHSLLPLVSGESIPGHCIQFPMLNTSIPRQAPERQSNSRVQS